MDRPGRRELALGLAAAGAAALTYAISAWNGFAWDDVAVIRDNAALRGDPLALFASIDRGRAVEPTPYYRPLTWLSFLAEERVHGLSPGPMHLVNVLLHAAGAFLVYRLARSVLDDRGVALAAALLFAVHPVGAETVNFLSGGRNTLLAGVCALGALLLHARSVRRGSTAALAGAAVLLLAGLLSKESAALVLPFIAAAEVTGGWGRPPAFTVRAATRLAPFAAAAALYLALRGRALSGAGVDVAVWPGLWERLANGLYAGPRALLSVAWPPSLSMLYPVPPALAPLALPLALAWLGIAAALWWLVTRGRSRASLFGLAWLVAFWLPVSGLVPIPSAPLADRYLYLPAIGLWIVVGDQLARLAPAGHPRRAPLALAGAGLLLLLAGASVSRSREWRDDLALFTAFVERHPDSAFGHHNLGTARLDLAGDLAAAERHFEAALAIDPGFPRTHRQLGYVWLLRGDLPRALAHYDLAVRHPQPDAEAHLNRAIVLDRLGRWAEAAREYRRFLAMPGDELPRARPDAERRLRDLERLGL